MYAIIESGSKQYKVAKGDVIAVERVAGQQGDTIVFDRVLAVKTDDGQVKVGDPVVKGAKATGKLVEEFKGKKVLVFHYKNKVNERRKRGHRQIHSKILIEDIDAGL